MKVDACPVPFKWVILRKSHALSSTGIGKTKVKTITRVLGMVVTLLVCTEPAYAYLDPGTGSILLQGLIAAIAGAMITGRLYWSRIKNFFSRKTEKS